MFLTLPYKEIVSVNLSYANCPVQSSILNNNSNGSTVSWDYFDKIYCISIDERPDRREEVKDQFEKTGLSNRVEFVVVEKHPKDCEQGIYESHLRCLEKGIKAGAGAILIFEDDIVFDRMSFETLGNCVTFMSENRDWHMLFLGCMVKGSQRTENRSVLKVKFRSLAHAYAISRKFAEKLIQTPWQQIPFDDVLRDLNDDRMYAAYPSFAFQGDSASDNEKYLPLDRFRRLCGGLRRLQKLNEFYHLNRSAIITVHTIAVLLVAILLFWPT